MSHLLCITVDRTIDFPLCRSRAIFNDPSLEDLGTYSCVVTNVDGVSASYTLTEEGESLSFNLRLQAVIFHPITFLWVTFVLKKGTQGDHYFLMSTESTAAADFFSINKTNCSTQQILHIKKAYDVSFVDYMWCCLLFLGLKRLLEISRDHQFPSKCFT